jgi:hypothetical protein
MKKYVTVLREKDVVKLEKLKSARTSHRKNEGGLEQVLEWHEVASCHQYYATWDSAPSGKVTRE